MTHTPGPWRFREYAQDADKIAQLREVGMQPTRALSNEGGAYVVAENVRVAVVDIQSEFKRGRGHESVCAERDANARLIAAAPTLYEALRGMVEMRPLAYETAVETLAMLSEQQQEGSR